MYSINTFTKKKYITPVIEFEMMEEEGIMAGVSGQGKDEEPGGDDGDNWAKKNDFIFDEEPETPKR